MSRQMKGNLILLLTAFVWGMGFVSQSLGMEYIGPFTFNCLRNIIASLFLIPCILLCALMVKAQGIVFNEGTWNDVLKLEKKQSQ